MIHDVDGLTEFFYHGSIKYVAAVMFPKSICKRASRDRVATCPSGQQAGSHRALEKPRFPLKKINVVR